MTLFDPRPLLAAALDQARQTPTLLAEMQRAQRDFFGGTMPTYARDPESLAAAEARFAEWFVLERESDTRGRPPAPELLADVGDGEDDRTWWADSQVGVYQIERNLKGRWLLRDLQTEAILELREDVLAKSGAHARLDVGGLLIGRLYGDDPLWASPSCVLQPPSGAPDAVDSLGDALRRDLSSLGLDRRLTQAEVEDLVFRRLTQAPMPALDGTQAIAGSAAGPGLPAMPPLEHLEAALDKMFREGGFAEYPAEEVSAALAAADSVGAVAGPLLEKLAFDTTVDLVKCQTLLTDIWAAQHQATGGTPPIRAVEPGSTPRLGSDLVRHLEQGLAGHRDLEQVFAEMAAMAGIDPKELEEDDDGLGRFAGRPDDGDDDEDGPRAAFENLQPLVQEYLWEIGEAAAKPVSEDQQAAAQQVLGALVSLTAALPVAVAQFEDLDSEHFLRLMLQGWLSAPPQVRAAQVRQIHTQLGNFVEWAYEQQDMDRREALAQCVPAFLDHLERLTDAAAILGSESPPSQPGLWRVDDVLEGGMGLRPEEGGEALFVAHATAPPTLRVGDLLVGELNPVGNNYRFSGMVVVLPEAAAGLLG